MIFVYNAFVMRLITDPLPPLNISLISLVAASAVFTQVPTYAAMLAPSIVDEDNPEYYDVANESYFFYYDQNRSQDASVQGTFLETSSSGSNTLISGYNDGDGIDGTPVSDNSYTDIGESLTLAQAGSITYEGESYVAFYLEANQKGKDDGTPGNNYYDVTKLQIQTSSSATITSYNPDDYDESSSNMAYYYNSADPANETIRLYYGAGNSNWDVVLYVPEDSFVLTDSDPNIPDAEETYIQFYVEYHNTAGPDYWGYDRGADIIPEPSSTLLVSLGAMIGLVRRRR